MLWPSRLALLALVPLGPWSASWPLAALALPFALSLVLFGLPHGAVDPFVLSRRPLGRLGVSAVYFAAALAVLALWALAPVACAIAFLVLTALHWGTCDLHTLLAFDGAHHLTTRTQRAATAAVRGGLPMLVPLVAAPEAYRRVLGWMAGALGTGGVGLGPAEALFRPDVRFALGTGFAALAVATLAVGWRRAAADGQRAWRLDAAETLGLALFFALVEPLLAVGLYFCLWHAPRHLARLVAWSPPAVARLDARRGVWLGFGRARAARNARGARAARRPGLARPAAGHSRGRARAVPRADRGCNRPARGRRGVDGPRRGRLGRPLIAGPYGATPCWTTELTCSIASVPNPRRLVIPRTDASVNVSSTSLPKCSNAP